MERINCIHYTGYSNCAHPDKGWLIFGKGCILSRNGNGFASSCKHQTSTQPPTERPKSPPKLNRLDALINNYKKELKKLNKLMDTPGDPSIKYPIVDAQRAVFDMVIGDLTPLVKGSVPNKPTPPPPPEKRSVNEDVYQHKIFVSSQYKSDPPGKRPKAPPMPECPVSYPMTNDELTRAIASAYELVHDDRTLPSHVIYQHYEDLLSIQKKRAEMITVNTKGDEGVEQCM